MHTHIFYFPFLYTAYWLHLIDCQTLLNLATEANGQWSEWSPWDCHTSCENNSTNNAIRTRSCLQSNDEEESKCDRDGRGVAAQEFMPCKFVCSKSKTKTRLLWTIRRALMFCTFQRFNVSIDQVFFERRVRFSCFQSFKIEIYC